MVVEALARNSTATLAVVKEYIVKRLQQEDEQINADRMAVSQVWI